MKRVILIIGLLLVVSVANAAPILQQLPIKVHGDTLFWNATGTPPYQWVDTLIGSGGLVVFDSLLNNMNDTFKILRGDSLFLTLLRSSSMYGHLYGSADSLGLLSASAYLNNVLDTFGILRGDSIKVTILQPMIANTGQVGTATNAFNSGYLDSVGIDYLFGKLERKIIIPATDTMKSSGTLLLASSDKSLLRIADTLVYQSQYSTSGGRDLFQIYGTGAGIGDGNVAWISVGGAGGIYGRGFFGGAYFGGADTGAAYVGANRLGIIYPVVRFDGRGVVTNLIVGGSFVADTGRFGSVKIFGTQINARTMYNPNSDAAMSIQDAFSKGIFIKSTNGAIVFGTDSSTDWKVHPKTIVGGTSSMIASDTLSGYNGNTWAVNSWGITITGVDTLAKFYMSSFDSTKFVRVWGSIKSVSSGGDPDTLVYKDSLATDSIKVTIAVGSKWLAPAVINKKWPTNPAGVVNPVYCIFRKGATTAAANMQFFTSYGLAKGRVF